MKKSLFIIMLFLFQFFKSQTIYTYTESDTISGGYFCECDSLIFTSSIDTSVKGGVSASNSILVMPNQNYSITILPSISCDNCTQNSDGTTIIPKKKGNEGANKKIHSYSQKTAESQEIIIEKNPVDDVLALSISKGLLKNIKIYNANGQEVLNKNNNGKMAVIDVSRFIKGVYWVKVITSENKSYTKHFIKK